MCPFRWIAVVVSVSWVLVASVNAARPAPAPAVSETPLIPPVPSDVQQIVFATRPFGPDGHYYANFGYYCFDPGQKAYAQGGGALCRLDLHSGQVTKLVDDPQGGVRDPQLRPDGRQIVFSWRRGGSEHYHLYEINVDGTGLRQLTDGPYDDLEPACLPGGDIVFCSSRCNRWVMCWKTPVAILYRCDADGRNIRMFSSNAVTENTPAVLNDGRLLYTRWEYVDRSQLCYHHLWTVNPDGTGQMTFYGNMHPNGMPYNLVARHGNVVHYENVPGAVAMLDAKPLPGTRDVVAIFSPGHGRQSHQGFVTIIDPSAGPDSEASAQRVHADGSWRDPAPLSPDTFLVARRRELHVMDRQGRTRLLYQLDDPRQALMLHEPVAIRRPQPAPAIAPRTDPAQTTGRLVLADVTVGRNMEGVEAGEIKRLLVMEQLPGPFHNSPGFDGISLWGSFTLTRILGTVPVEPDGSAHFEVPALRSLLFVALDEHDLAVKKMQSFVTVQPGEVTGCVGCHEKRTTAPANAARASLLAVRRPASVIEPIPGAPEIVDFRRHIQPILDKHCVSCHGPQRADADLVLSGDRGVPSHGAGRVLVSYVALVQRLGEIADGRNAHGNRPPRAIGSGGSRLMSRIDGSHYDVRVSPTEAQLVRLWLDSGAVANGTYAVMDGGTPEEPSPNYVREMQRYGILPPDFAAGSETFDAYAADQAYWQSFWYQPQ
jgi:hypothetical protein